ncbi:MAG TPA: hypothetical protein VHS28_06450, partial [Chloroflexota bacterium]|nr:hypothetical protein [Chloroflexota bacterium]
VSSGQNAKATYGVLDYAILYGDVLYELIFTCPAERFEQYRPLFDRMARSLRFVESVAPGSSVSNPGWDRPMLAFAQVP